MRCRNNRGAAILLAGLVLLLWPAWSRAEELTVITSAKLTVDYNKRFALFEGDVLVVDPRMKIYADQMTVQFNEQNKADKVVAKGRVIIVQEDKRARAAEAEYHVASGEINLKGNPMVMKGKNIFTADLMQFWRDEERLVGHPQARLVIYPEGDMSADALFGEPLHAR